MDGLSAAASGIAVVSLAIQLVDSVREIRRFLRSVSNAPKELERLIDLLEQLEQVLQQVATLVEKQQNAEFGETNMSTNILRAIKTCESKISMLESLIEATKQAASTSNRATRTIGSLKLACKKKDIQGFEGQLHDAVNLLTLTMMANLTYIHSNSMERLLSHVSVTNQTTSTISQELALMRTGFTSDREVISNETHDLVRETARSPVSRNKSTTCSTYTGLFGKLLVKRTSSTAMSSSEGLQSSPGTYTVVESSWVFIPSFLSSCVDFRYLSTCGNIQRSVRTYAVISSNRPVWNMCRKGDLKGVQKLLSGRQISPFCVNHEGETLLHRAAGSLRSEVCELLFEIGLTGEEVDAYGNSTYSPRAFLLITSESGIRSWERTYRLLASHLDDVNPAFLGSGPFSWIGFDLSADMFSRMVEDFVSKRTSMNLSTPQYCVL